MNAMKTEHQRQLGRAAVPAGVGALLVVAALVFTPEHRHGDATVSGAAGAAGPGGRAMTAVAQAAPAAPADLAALIGDREAWVGKHPDDRKAWAVLGSAYVARGTADANWSSYPKAEKALRRALPSAGATDPAALIGLAQLDDARGDFAAAAKWAGRAVTLRPKDAAGYPALIAAEEGLGDRRAGDRAAARLAALRPAAPVLPGPFADGYPAGYRTRSAARAADALHHAGTPAGRAAAQCELGRLAWESGRPNESLAHYDAALGAVPGLPTAGAGRARALASLGRTGEAALAYQKAFAAAPRPVYALELGELYESQGLTGDAATQFAALRTAAAKAHGYGVDVDLVLGRYEAGHAHPGRAVTRLTAAWRRGHHSAEVADALGWALFRADRPRSALPYARLATGGGLHSALFSYHRGEIERALGDTAGARRDLQLALRTNPYFSPLLAPRARDVLAAMGPATRPAAAGASGPEATGPQAALGPPAPRAGR